MKTRYIVLLSILIGLAAVSFDAFPMWWGVLFAPITEQLSSVPISEELTKGFCWEMDGVVLRLRGLDLIAELFSRFR